MALHIVNCKSLHIFRHITNFKVNVYFLAVTYNMYSHIFGIDIYFFNIIRIFSVPTYTEYVNFNVRFSMKSKNKFCMYILVFLLNIITLKLTAEK